MRTNVRRNTSGFTLVEVVISLLILAIAAAGLVSFLISIQYMAEDNLYESTALTVAISTLEQMKSMATENLENSMNSAEFELNTGVSGIQVLALEEANELSVPIVTNTETPKSVAIVLTPNIESIAGDTQFWLRVQYQYNHPRNDRTRTKVIGCIRSRVNSY